jgi:Nucleotide modification associated domain 3
VKAILVRVAVDHSYGHWNAPVELESGQFVYVPIPEKDGTSFLPGLACAYDRIMPALNEFCKRFAPERKHQLGFPQALQRRQMHLDPDFEYLTYGDRGDRRGARISQLTEGDLLVFYAGLRPVRPMKDKLIYSLVGLYVVRDVVLARNVPQSLRGRNAHTRKEKVGRPDIVVTAKPGVSGRLERCIPIGEWRDRAYRVRRDILKAWGGLSVKDGYIQRSAVPPTFRDARRFYEWFSQQSVRLMNRNN